MRPSKSLHNIDCIWDVFCHRVDASVCIAIGDEHTAEIHLERARNVFDMCGWMVGADVFIEGGAVEFDSEMRRHLCFYTEYLEVYESGLKSGVRFAAWDRENDLSSHRENEEENDDSDWCGSFVALQEIPEEYDALWADD